MNHMTKVILISAGDPDSISTEITIKAIQHSKMNKNVKPVVVSNSKIIAVSYTHLTLPTISCV